MKCLQLLTGDEALEVLGELLAMLSFAKTASALTVEKSAEALTHGLNTVGSCGVRRQLAPSALSIGGNERRVLR